MVLGLLEPLIQNHKLLVQQQMHPKHMIYLSLLCRVLLQLIEVSHSELILVELEPVDGDQVNGIVVIVEHLLYQLSMVHWLLKVVIRMSMIIMQMIIHHTIMMVNLTGLVILVRDGINHQQQHLLQFRFNLETQERIQENLKYNFISMDMVDLQQSMMDLIRSYKSE